MAPRSVLPLLYGPEDHATSVTTCRILYQRHPRLTQVVLEKKLLKLSWKGDTLSTFKRHLKFHLFQSAFTVQSSCASDSDSFSRFLALYKLVCMYVCICMTCAYLGLEELVFERQELRVVSCFVEECLKVLYMQRRRIESS